MRIVILSSDASGIRNGKEWDSDDRSEMRSGGLAQVLNPTSPDRCQNLTTEEVAAILNMPIGTLRWWRHKKEGPRSFKLGRSVRYKKADVEAWLRDQYEAGSESA